MVAFPEYAEHDATGLAELVRTKQVTPLELVDAALARIDRLNPKLNAVIHRFDDLARAAAREPAAGPFAGVPFLAKDLVSEWKGTPMCSGTRFARDYVSPGDNEIVRRTRAAGVVLVGKTNTPELGLVPTTEPDAFGPTRNPWDLGRTVGGSSGGAGCAVAAGLVPVAGGGDGGGSIRIPASCNGVFGMKPSRGRNPVGPARGEGWQGFVAEHVLTRSVRDSAAMLDALSGPEPGGLCSAPPPERPFVEAARLPPGKLRIAFTTKGLLPSTVHADCVAAVTDAAKLLADLGHEVTEEHPVFDAEHFSLDFITMLVGETAATVKEMEATLGRRHRRGDLEAATEVLALLGEATSSLEFSLALRRLKRLGMDLAGFFARYDMLLTPTLAQPPVEIGSLLPKGAEKTLLSVMSALGAKRLLAGLGVLPKIAAKAWNFAAFTAPFNVTGQPACSVPLFWNAAGLPIGVQLVGRMAEEGRLFSLAAQLETARPWKDRRAPGFGVKD
jgi:amidase